MLWAPESSPVTKILVKVGPRIFHGVCSAMPPLYSSSAWILINESCSQSKESWYNCDQPCYKENAYLGSSSD